MEESWRGGECIAARFAVSVGRLLRCTLDEFSSCASARTVFRTSCWLGIFQLRWALADACFTHVFWQCSGAHCFPKGGPANVLHKVRLGRLPPLPPDPAAGHLLSSLFVLLVPTSVVAHMCLFVCVSVVHHCVVGSFLLSACARCRIGCRASFVGFISAWIFHRSRLDDARFSVRGRFFPVEWWLYHVFAFRVEHSLGRVCREGGFKPTSGSQLMAKTMAM